MILLSSIPFYLMVNVTLSKMILEPIIDIWDILSMLIIIIFASVLFRYDYIKNKEQKIAKNEEETIKMLRKS